MIASFWQQLPRPFVGLSPMDGVTDLPFRTITKRYGKPDLMFTEFSSVEGLCRGASELLKEFLYSVEQRPIVAQIYGTTPEFFRQMTIALCQLGFDGVDINMGCPAKNVAHSGAGAALIKTPELAIAILQAAKQGVKDWQAGQTVDNCPNLTPEIRQKIQQQIADLNLVVTPKPIPVSVKTRIGYDSISVTEWVRYLLEAEPVAITLHGRTLRQGYSGLANWEEIGKAVQTIKDISPTTLVLGNGDVASRQDALNRCQTYGVDGVLIGRASFGDPWVFGTKTPENPAAVALEHAQLFEQAYGANPRYSFLPMRKHLAWYIKGMPQAREIRSRLVRANSSEEARAIFVEFGLLAG